MDKGKKKQKPPYQDKPLKNLSRAGIMGRPRMDEELPTEDIIYTMLKWSKRGKFFCQMPACIFEDHKAMVSIGYLESIKHPDFIRAKSLCAAYCSGYWTEKAADTAIPSTMWTFIMKNVVGWAERRDVKIEGSIETRHTDPEAARAVLEELKRQISEKV